ILVPREDRSACLKASYPVKSVYGRRTVFPSYHIPSAGVFLKHIWLYAVAGDVLVGMKFKINMTASAYRIVNSSQPFASGEVGERLIEYHPFGIALPPVEPYFEPRHYPFQRASDIPERGGSAQHVQLVESHPDGFDILAGHGYVEIRVIVA